MSTASPDEPSILDTAAAGPRIIRGGALRVAGYVAGSALSVISAAVLTRHLGPADFGRYSVVFALLTVVAGIADAGTVTLGVREHSVRAASAGRQFLRHLLGIRLVVASAGVLAALLFAFAAGYDEAMVAGTAAGGIGLILTIVYGTLSIPLQSSLRLGWVAGLDLIRQAATVVGLVGFAAVGAGIVPLLAVPVPVGLLLIAVTLTLIDREGGWSPSVDRAEWAAIARLTLPFAAAAVSGILYAQVSLLALSIVASERDAGLFAAAFRVYFVLAAVPGLLVASAFPLLARASRDDRGRLGYAVSRLWEVCLIAGAGTALVTAVAAPVALDIVAGAGYSAAVDELRLLSIALMATFVIALGGFTLLALERYWALVMANLAALLVSGALAASLGGSLGETAGAIAVVCADLTLAVLYLVGLARGADGIRLGGGIVVKVAIASALAAAPLLIGGVPVVVQAAVVGIVFAGAIVLLRAVPAELVDAVRSLRRGTATEGDDGPDGSGAG